MTTESRILRNVGALTAARGVTAVLTFVTTIYLARVLEPAAYGMLSWALAYLAYFRLIPDLGLSVWATRETARNPDRVGHIAGHLLSLRLFFAAAAAGLFLIGVLLLDEPAVFKLVVAVQGLTLFGAAVSLEWVYQGIERMGILAVRNVVVAAIALVGAVVLVRAPEHVVTASGVLAFSLIGGNLWLLLTYRRHFGTPRLMADWSVWRSMVIPALPIGMSLALVAINVNMDQLMIGLLRTPEEVGWYGAAYRILLAVTIPAQILLQAFLPALSNSVGDIDTMRHRATSFARALLAIGLPAGAAGVVFAPELIGVFGAAYAPAVVAFSILMVHGALQYVHMMYGNPLIAWDRQKWYMWALAAGATINVVLNILLIPRFGIEGAAVATLSSEVVIVGIVAILHFRVAGQAYGHLLARAIGVTAASVGVVAVLRHLFDLGFFPGAGLAILLYILAATALGLVNFRSLLMRRSSA